MTPAKELNAEQLYHRADPAQFDFQTTAELTNSAEFIGQERAIDAMRFGTGMQRDGYNIFALGPTGMGKRTLVQQFFEQRAQAEPVPPDWCYVYNFDEPRNPRSISLPSGKGSEFRHDMDEFIEQIQTALSTAFESEEYQTRRQAVLEEFGEQQAQAFRQLQEKAQQRNVAVLRTPAGLAFAPMREGQVLEPTQLQALTEEERKQIEVEIEHLQDDLHKILRQLPAQQRTMQDRLKSLNREVAGFAVGGVLHELREKYAAQSKIVEHLNAVEKDVVENAQNLIPAGPEEGQQATLQALLQGRDAAGAVQASLRRYKVNLLVDNSRLKGAPVVYEDNPNYQNLVGRVEHMAQMGALVTDFNLIQPGSLHRATGGYLILDARKMLLQPFAWDALKRVLQSRQIKIESMAQAMSLISTVSLEPEPIPLDVKIALVGERELYYLLYQMDPEFPELFKVEADFEDSMDRNKDSQVTYARLIGTLAKEQDLHPFDRGAVARIIEHSSRAIEDGKKLSTRMRPIIDLLHESDYWAMQAGHTVVGADDVQRAIDSQIDRADRVRDRVQEGIQRDIKLIDTTGARVGQINGLSVMQLGTFAFGTPTRITAQIRMGKGEVVDIEREVELGGPIHSKGVMILSGFFGGRYAEDQPLSLSASLVFEQSYGGVEGDSASSAELYTLLSAISGVPIKQSFAVTGSVNQHGQVQPIGGVNEKIEGFFDVCKERGLTGEQGVLIPVSNVQHLMLRSDVRDAVAAGKFHVYSVETIDQGIELLTGVPAGERDPEGNYPEGTINYKVEQRLQQMTKKREELEHEKEEEGQGE